MIIVFFPVIGLDIDTYKPCIPDITDCPADQICFKYFCYPKSGASTPLKSCKKRSDCNDDPNATKCFKRSRSGICVSEEDYELCLTHEQCNGRGGKCCFGFCCNEKYYQALLAIECEDYYEKYSCEVKYIPYRCTYIPIYYIEGVHKVFALVKNLAIKKKSTIVVQYL